jgi:hypothetical protein
MSWAVLRPGKGLQLQGGFMNETDEAFERMVKSDVEYHFSIDMASLKPVSGSHGKADWPLSLAYVLKLVSD